MVAVTAKQMRTVAGMVIPTKALPRMLADSWFIAKFIANTHVLKKHKRCAPRSHPGF